MGYFYSLGIGFDNEENALNCKNDFDKSPLVLSDLSTVAFFCHFSKVRTDRILSIHPIGMEFPSTNVKFFELPFYYEIRNALYLYLEKLSVDFLYAYWECEAADTLLSDDIREELLRAGSQLIGEIGGDGATYFSGKPSSCYLSKRLYDGLVINEQIFMSTGSLPEFEIFKPGYYWVNLPGYSLQKKKKD